MAGNTNETHCGYQKLKQKLKEMHATGDLRDVYSMWANDYDSDIGTLNYKGPQLVAEKLVAHSVPKTARILDVAAGTGLAGAFLHDQCGYHNLDALDASQHMLDIARQKHIYHNHLCFMFGKDHKSNIKEDEYDVVISVGGFGPQHMELDCFEEMIRIVRPGGLVVISLRNEVRLEMRMDEAVQSHVASGLWQVLVDEVLPAGFYMDKDSVTFVFRITKPPH